MYIVGALTSKSHNIALTLYLLPHNKTLVVPSPLISTGLQIVNKIEEVHQICSEVKFFTSIILLRLRKTVHVYVTRTCATFDESSELSSAGLMH